MKERPFSIAHLLTNFQSGYAKQITSRVNENSSFNPLEVENGEYYSPFDALITSIGYFTETDFLEIFTLFLEKVKSEDVARLVSTKDEDLTLVSLISNGKSKEVDLLLEKFGDQASQSVNTQDQQGDTALHHLFARCKKDFILEILPKLLAKGANLEAENLSKETIIHKVLSGVQGVSKLNKDNKRTIITHLVRLENKPNFTVEQSSRILSAAFLQDFLEILNVGLFSPDEIKKIVNTIDKDTNISPLGLLILFNKTNTYRDLLSRGLITIYDGSDKDGNLPIHIWAKQVREDRAEEFGIFLDELQELGVDILLKNRKNQSIFDIIEANNPNKKEECKAISQEIKGAIQWREAPAMVITGSVYNPNAKIEGGSILRSEGSKRLTESVVKRVKFAELGGVDQ